MDTLFKMAIVPEKRGIPASSRTEYEAKLERNYIQHTPKRLVISWDKTRRKR